LGDRAPCLNLDDDWVRIEQQPGDDPDGASAADNILYVAYTSGSTGRPKGVLGLHRGTINRLGWMWEKYPFAADEVCCQKTSLGFVDSAWEIFGPLLRGVRTAIIGSAAAKDPVQLARCLERHQVTRLVLVPPLLGAMLDSGVDLDRSLCAMKVVTC